MKYFVVKMEEGRKKLMCPFQLEDDLASQVGGAVESIRGSGRDSFLVTVYSKNQSDKIRCIKQIAGNNCQVSEVLGDLSSYKITTLATFRASQQVLMSSAG